MLSKFINNNSKKTLVLFHGTGGNEDVLLPLARQVAPDFNYLSFRGDVVMGGLRRFCKVSDGNNVMDEEDMFERVPNILEIVKQKAERFGLEDMWVLGFSNGANTISAMLLNQETPFKKAILLRPMDITLDAPINDLKNIDILIHSGRFDDIIPMESSIALEHRLRSKNAIVENIIYDLDHRMRQYEIDELKNWFERKKND